MNKLEKKLKGITLRDHMLVSFSMQEGEWKVTNKGNQQLVVKQMSKKPKWRPWESLLEMDSMDFEDAAGLTLLGAFIGSIIGICLSSIIIPTIIAAVIGALIIPSIIIVDDRESHKRDLEKHNNGDVELLNLHEMRPHMTGPQTGDYHTYGIRAIAKTNTYQLLRFYLKSKALYALPLVEVVAPDDNDAIADIGLEMAKLAKMLEEKAQNEHLHAQHEEVIAQETEQIALLAASERENIMKTSTGY